jgi:HAD superfamily phosphatase (TIGR01668 family)
MLKEWLSKLFKPDYHFRHIWNIPVEYITNDIWALIIDLDNTMALKGECISDERVLDWIDAVKWRYPDIKIVILSNLVFENEKRLNRLVTAANDIHAEYYAAYRGELKPKREAFLNALELVHCDPEHAIMIGDQLFTDIYGAKRVGVRWTFLVDPLGPDSWFTTPKRWLEKPLRWYLEF